MPVSRPKQSYNLAIGAASVSHQIATTSNITMVRLLATVTCCVRIGPTAAADTTTTSPQGVQPIEGVEFYL
jgi:hypothetical protein